MKSLTIKELACTLSQGNHYLILTHRRPDGDTLGSAAALCRGLRALGKTAWVLENPQMTPRYQSYLQGLTTPVPPEGAKVITVDVAGAEMLPQGWGDRAVDLILDHHGTNRGFAPEGHVDGSAAACGELVYELLMALGVSLDKAMAEALYVAISTDTGCFRYSNTTAHTLAVASACYGAGAECFPINKALFETVSFARLKLNAYMTEHLVLFQNGKFALCFIPWELETSLGLTEDDLEDVSGYAKRIAGVELAVTFRSLPNGDTKLSVRSSPRYDAAALCAQFGGGGHKAAAGATVHMTQEKAGELVRDALKDLGYV